MIVKGCTFFTINLANVRDDTRTVHYFKHLSLIIPLIF